MLAIVIVVSIPPRNEYSQIRNVVMMPSVLPHVLHMLLLCPSGGDRAGTASPVASHETPLLGAASLTAIVSVLVQCCRVVF